MPIQDGVQTMTRTMMLPAALAIALGLGACAEMSDTGRRTATGAGIGAAGGALVGSLTGSAGWGAVIGAGAGAAGGYLYDQHRQSEQRAYQQGVAEGRAQR
jgi:hypothetical protein